MVFSDPGCSGRVESAWGSGGGSGGGSPGRSHPDSLLEHWLGAVGARCVWGDTHGLGQLLAMCSDRLGTASRAGVLGGLGTAVPPGPGRTLFPTPPAAAGAWPSLGTIAHEPQEDGVAGEGPGLQGTCVAVPPPCKTQTFCACGWEWLWPQPWALCRGNPTGNEPGQMAALPVLVPGTRICCLTSGGGPGRLAAVLDLVCAQSAPPDPRGAGLDWGPVRERAASGGGREWGPVRQTLTACFLVVGDPRSGPWGLGLPCFHCLV